MKKMMMIVVSMFFSVVVQAGEIPLNPVLSGRVDDAGSFNQWALTAGDRGGTDQTALLVFELPVIPAGETVTSADLELVLKEAGSWNPFNGDLYAVRVNASSDPMGSDYYLGGYNAGNGGIQNDFVTPASGVGVLSTDASAEDELGAWIAAVYANDVTAAGKYIFLRISADAAPSSSYQGYSFAQNYNTSTPPVLTVTTGESAPEPEPEPEPIDPPSAGDSSLSTEAVFSGRVASDGSFSPWAAVAGDQGGDAQSAMMVFELPSIPEGATVSSANLDVFLETLSPWSGFNADLYAVRSADSSVVLESDYFTGAYGTDGASQEIQDDWMVPSSASASLVSTDDAADSGLGVWIASIYANDPDAAGKYIFLRMSADSAPLANSYRYYRIHQEDKSNSPVPNFPPVLTLIMGGGSTPIDPPSSDGGGSTLPGNAVSSGRIDENGSFNSWALFAGDRGTVNQAAIMVFELPEIPSGETVSAAHLEVVLKEAGTWNPFHGDLYAVRVNSSSSPIASDYYLGAYTASSGGVQDNFVMPGNGAGVLRTDSSGSAALGDWIADIYANDSSAAGKYLFLRVSADNTPSDTYQGYSFAQAYNTDTPPVLTVVTGDGGTLPSGESQSLSCLPGWSHRDGALDSAWSVGVTASGFRADRYPRVGNATWGSAEQSANVMAFQLPDLRGASMESANFKFTIVENGGSRAAKIDLYALRCTDTPQPLLASDFWNGTPIQSDLVGSRTLLGEHETGENTALKNWLQAQYDAVGAGGYVFLRLTPQGGAPDVGAHGISKSGDTMPALVIVTDGTERVTTGTSQDVSVQMGSTKFKWTFDQPVQWGLFIDGQPWVVRPSSGLKLIAVEPARQSGVSVKLPYHPYREDPTSVSATINMTVINPPVGSYLKSDGTYYRAGSENEGTPGAFGWDDRGKYKRTTYWMEPNSELAWNGSPIALNAGDSITSAKSTLMESSSKDRASMLDAVAVLTVLSAAPPSDAFRPGPIRGGTERTNPTLVRYSDLYISSGDLISAPIGGDVSLRGEAVDAIGNDYTFPVLRQLLPGPSFLNFGATSTSEGCSALYNNSSRVAIPAAGSYGGELARRFGLLAMGSVANWLEPEERTHCQIRFMQRAIDSYSAVDAGLTLQVDAGILSGYSTMITAAGAMLKGDSPLREKMLSVNQGVHGVAPELIFADYGMTYYSIPLSGGTLPSGVSADHRGFDYTSSIPSMNMEVGPSSGLGDLLGSVSDNSLTANLSWEWPTIRPMVDLINVKMKITSGSGAGDQIYVITNAPSETFYYYNQGSHQYEQSPGGTAANFNRGGAIQFKPGWQNGHPASDSVIVFSVLTSEDQGRWIFTAHGDAFRNGETPLEGRKGLAELTDSPNNGAYVSNHLGGHLDQLIVLYALNAEDRYLGGMDYWAIDAGAMPGMGESCFNDDRYLGLLTTERFRGALWKQEVLEKSTVNEAFIYTDGTPANLEIPSNSAKMWTE